MHVFILYLCYAFLSYMIAEGITYIFSVKNTEEISETTPQPSPIFNVKSKMPVSKNFKSGDIIQFIFLKNETQDRSFKYHPGRRSISTYGYEEIEPEENIDYIVTCVEDYGNIRNHKGKSNVDKSMNNVDTFMYVFPKKEYDEMDGMFEHTKEIFWFINLKEMTICQYEDAYPLHNIACITCK